MKSINRKVQKCHICENQRDLQGKTKELTQRAQRITELHREEIIKLNNFITSITKKCKTK
jgi:hypothetical protein